MGPEEAEHVLEGRARQAEQQLQIKDQQLMEAQSELEKVTLGLTLLSADTYIVVGSKKSRLLSCLA